MNTNTNSLDFHAYRTVAPSLFGATVRTALQNLLNINPTSVGKTVVLENDATTGFLSFRLQAAYARPHYRAAYTKAAAEKEWNEIKASLHRRQASLQSPVSGGALPPLFPDYLQVESLVPIYYQSSPQGVPILHYWELRLLPRFTNPLYQKRHSLGSGYHPELGKIGKVPLSEGFREAAQKEIALLGESVTVHFAEGRIIGLDYHHLPVLKENSTEKVDLYPALFQTVAPQTPETDDTESLAAKSAKTTKKANETAQENLSGILLFKRKGDLLLPFVRLNDGREVAASVEGEGGQEEVSVSKKKNKPPLFAKTFPSIHITHTEGYIYYMEKGKLQRRFSTSLELELLVSLATTKDKQNLEIKIAKIINKETGKEDLRPIKQVKHTQRSRFYYLEEENYIHNGKVFSVLHFETATGDNNYCDLSDNNKYEPGLALLTAIYEGLTFKTEKIENCYPQSNVPDKIFALSISSSAVSCCPSLQIVKEKTQSKKEDPTIKTEGSIMFGNDNRIGKVELNFAGTPRLDYEKFLRKNEQHWQELVKTSEEITKLRADLDERYKFFDGLPSNLDIDGHVFVCKDTWGAFTLKTRESDLNGASTNEIIKLQKQQERCVSLQEAVLHSLAEVYGRAKLEMSYDEAHDFADDWFSVPYAQNTPANRERVTNGQYALTKAIYYTEP